MAQIEQTFRSRPRALSRPSAALFAHAAFYSAVAFAVACVLGLIN
jgi:hypothetical protein